MDALIDWLGHATVRIELGGIRILTDPAIRPRVGPLVRMAPRIEPHQVEGVDLVLISHLHHDHLDLGSLRRLGAPRLIVPSGSASIFGAAGLTNVDEVSPGDRRTDGSVTIEVVHAEHSGFRPPFGPTGPALGFVVSDGVRRIYFAGDTAIHAGMAALGDLDVALVPVWGWGPTLRGGHMDPLVAAEALTLLRPRLAIPIHWGTYWPVALGRVRRARLHDPGDEFRARAAAMAPSVRAVVLEPGERVAVEVGSSLAGGQKS